ncbi:glycoside hydrolase family 18 protein [Shivajiella indica]|uniref:chitinase n=1 Tax=Shivajiella indica TaxID=872115 RepID=A0ABW5B8Q7_9BACT
MKQSISLFLIIVLIFFSCGKEKKDSVIPASKEYKVIGYIAGWKGVDPERIQADKLTHINYAFANVIDGVVIEGEGRAEQDKENITKLRSLKSINPDLKILISIGGWTWSKGFSDAVLTEESRKKFTESAIDYLIRHQLDGLDFDWEYPGYPGDDNPYRVEDRENFVLMLKSVREALDSLGKVNNTYYLSTIATGGFKEYVDVNDLGEAQKYLDFINIMTYDFTGVFKPMTGHHTNLSTSEVGGRSAENAVIDHVAAGVPVEKLVMGIAFYGKAWKSVNPKDNGLSQPATGWRNFPYREIELFLEDDNYAKKWDSLSNASYLWNERDSIFVTYESPASIHEKIAFIKNKGMGGVMFWEYHEDSDSRTLLNAIHDEINNP